ncbi:ectopic P granules protein 5 homolog isoform X2 [Aplysia californica]|uniref:Ectopic P granules protein 5 homolog isoform X2 n=1 Tax=Aplysia californica TaxID=6500 RepID=A0ABM1W3A7_APLCA|nr:ectopic P granules protein 5 homolog isoform X2 [Aplysia californica]
MIKTTKMAEAVRPRPRKQKSKKTKQASAKSEVNEEAEDNVCIQDAVKAPVEEQTPKDDPEQTAPDPVPTEKEEIPTGDGAIEEGTIHQKEKNEEKQTATEFESEDVAEESGTYSDARELLSGDYSGGQEDCVTEEQAGHEARPDQSINEKDTKEGQAFVEEKVVCENESTSAVPDGSSHVVPERPHTLLPQADEARSSPALSHVSDQERGPSLQHHEPTSVHSPPSAASLAAHMQRHHTSSLADNHRYRVGSPNSPLHIDGPAVVEDPDTPMMRATSPQIHKTLQRESTKSPPPTVPTVVYEEKSPTLMAEEALARMRAMDLQLRVEPSHEELASPVTDVLPGNSSVSFTAASHDTASKSSQSSEIWKKPGEKILSTQQQEIAATPAELMQTQNKSVSEEKTAVNIAEQPKVSTKSAFPVQELEKEKQKKGKLGAMTLEELLALYYNPQLAYNARFIDDFVQRESKKDSHEFLEILSNYFRTRHQLVSVEEDIHSLQKNYSGLQKELWQFQMKTITVQGQCADQAKVTINHSYEQCLLNDEAVNKMGYTLETIRSQITDNLSLFAYSAQISALQVESYIHDLYVSCPIIRDIPKNAPIQSRLQVLPQEEHQIQRLKDCISILFMFHRKPTLDGEFINNIRQWTVRLTSSLLRVATFSDHLFILNHLLRCPSGVGRWAAELVQLPVLTPVSSAPHQQTFGGPLLDHTITALATVLLPAKAREEFMCHMRINLSAESIQDERAWILVDSDGEEDEDPANTWLYLHENDIVALLNQFPLADLYAHIMMAGISESGSVDYDIRRSTEPMMIRLFAFSTVLIQLFGSGLTTYNMARYRQLNKRLGRLIRQTVCFVSDHWLNFKIYYGPLAPVASMETLQLEFDQLFMRATYSILTAQKLGSWQFMADMPYTCVSTDSMWQLLWVLHQGQGQVVNLDRLPPVQKCKEYLEDPDSWQQLADNLLHMPTSEAIYLLTTFANMASCRSYEEEAFIQTITLEVFEIAYICNHTREFCSKVGRELLSGIIQTHPTALSFLLARVKDVLAKLGKMSLYLFSELPVSIWQPSDPDILILRQWLLNFDLLSSENQLARVILGKINWDVFEQTGRLVVDVRLHRQMALLLVEAYTRFIADKKAGFFIMEGMRQMAFYMSSSLTAEQSFNNWVWDLAIRLKLHQHSVLLHAMGVVDLNFQPPNLGGDAWLLPVLKGTSNKTPIACFVALTMTNIGHDITSFISEGLDLLAVLTANYQYTTAIHVIGCVFPMFIDCPQYLLENINFIQIIQSLLGADESLLKSTKSTIMSVEFPGLVTQQLTEMIQALITSHLTHRKGDKVIMFWVNVIFKVCKFFTDRNSCYVADTLIQWCFVKKGVNDVMAMIFRENYLKFCYAFKNRQGALSSMWNWIASSTTLPSYMDSASLPEFPWLAYMILMVEGESEVNSRLWQMLIMELHSPNRPNIDNGLRVAVSKLHLEQAPTASRLTIYRWAQQALDTPFDHPLLPILWQRFFALYLGRQVFESCSIAQRASVGERFFESMSYSHMLKKMRKRLIDTSNFHMNFDPQKDGSHKRRRSSHSPTTPPIVDPSLDFGPGTARVNQEAEEITEYASSVEFHRMLAKLFQTYSLWLEEPRLHDGNLYLPALPPQYEAVRLNQVFQGFMGPWIEFVDLDGVQYTLSCLAADWRKRLTCSKTALYTAAAERRNTMIEQGDATERITRRLRRYDTPKPAPAIQNVASPVPEISTAILEDKEALNHLLVSDLQVLTHFTKVFAVRCAQHCALDNVYLELIPNLWANLTKTVQLNAPCKSKVNPLHRCTGPAVLPVKIESKEMNEMMNRRIEENRAEYKQVMIESLLPTAPHICVAAVHTENAITMLIKMSQRSSDTSRVKRLHNIACDLFFRLADMVCDEVNFYPPTKQFFASCMEILGQEFVSRDAAQTEAVLQLCLENPKVSGLVSPHFVPNSCPAQLVTMYGQLLHVLQAQNMELVFMLLTKFDIRQWLESHNPREAERKMLVESLGAAMMACGAEPEANSKLVFGLYLAHLAALLESRFPSNLCLVVNMVLQGSAAERLHTQVWETLLRCCFTDRVVHTADDAETRQRTDSVFDAAKVEACVDSPMSTVQVKELLDWLGAFFSHAKMSGGSENFGLYSHWSRYVPYLGLMIGALAQSFITKVVNGSEEMQPFQVLELVWQPVISVYSPWLQPLVTPDGQMTAPWLEGDSTQAVIMVASLKKSVLHLYQLMHAKHPTSSGGVLSLLLMYYMTALSTKVTPAHVSDVYVNELKELPWKCLWPDLQLLETMTKLKEVASTCCYALVGHILPQIKWREVMSHFSSQLHPDLASRMVASLAVLLVQSYVDPTFSEDENTCRLLTEAETFDWSLVRQDGFSCVCSWFLQLAEPKCALAQRSSNLALGLRVLKRMSGFLPDVPWTDQISTKRLSFIHCLTQQLCQVTYLSDVSTDAVGTAINNLMSDVEAVESSVPSPEIQAEESASLLKDVLSLLNNSNPDGPWLEVIMSSVTGWLRSSPHSILLVPCMKAASRCLASLSQMAAVMEAGIEVYFSGLDGTSPVSGSDPTGWSFILTVFQVPELNQAGYVQESLSENAFLVLYAYLQHRLPFCQRPEEELGLMEAILDWTCRALPSAEDESKLILWWHMMLFLTQRLVDAPWSSLTGVVNVLSRFSNHLNSLGQDRTSRGFFGVIGLGRKSSLSYKMRLLARALSAFLSCQLVTAEILRVYPTMKKGSNNTLQELRALKKNKTYAQCSSTIDHAVEFVQDPNHTIRDSLLFLATVVKDLYSDKQYLSVVWQDQ